ncbi:MAG: DarT ssDNA thymidine ADP-ribosyltransferase family protein [Anaerolineae bacterium]
MKPWKDDIERHIHMWSARLGNRRWWPRYVYHFTDVQNAANIIQIGQLYSRTEVERLGLMQVDNASQDIIRQTRPEHLEYVRLYFRPRTPTQFRNEGIRPVNQRELGGAHCPIPVYFCFDALTVLVADDTEFSDGNMASTRASHSDERGFFLGIPFDLVFHDRPIIPPEDPREITFRRNAEVLVPSSLSLDPALRFIACRSAAERQTLVHLLPANLRRQWAPRIRLGEQGLFFRKWAHVEEVVAVDNVVIFRFNPSTTTRLHSS